MVYVQWTMAGDEAREVSDAELMQFLHRKFDARIARTRGRDRTQIIRDLCLLVLVLVIWVGLAPR